jgi:adenylate cyclase
VLRLTERDRRQIRDAFSRYVSPSIVEVLSRDPSRLVLGGEDRVLTVLFSDIRNFTSISETMPAQEVVRFLNNVHAPMTEHVLNTNGTLDKFIGDGMMAFWNAPLDHPDHVRAALRTALRMETTLETINGRLAAEAQAAGRPHAPLGLGIGIHTGMACIGNIGSARRFDYSAIGDTVNTSARLEPMCKVYGVNVIVSSEVVAAAPDFAYLLLDMVKLKGKSQQTRLYALMGDEGYATAAFEVFRDAHDEAVELMIARRSEGRERLRACLSDPFGSRCSRLYALLEERAGRLEPEYEV